ncbi:MAG: dehydrogenase [Planctomycetia bacterium]|jgi:predicted dehydrogenase|nr:Gfo/Idh/MocA family oxidoreductase [Planctomycetota bacterium]OQZ05721.1 MAG: hypothetical protein B6D36_08715 [Planctomycetes bacterium UTPLA1]
MMSTSTQSLGIGIIGCGRVVEKRVAPAMIASARAKLVAFCSRDGSKARQFAESFGASAAYNDVSALLADDKVQAIYIAVPNAFHAELAIRCLQADRHVLVDKPMALSTQQALSMISASRQSGKTLGLMHQQRFHPVNQKLIKLIREGSLGRIHFVRAQMGFWYSLAENWRLSPELSGGGAAIDLAPHVLDILLHAMGPIRSVDARCYDLHLHRGVEDLLTARVEFASGAVGQLDFSYCFHHYGGRIEVYGSEGTFLADGSLQQADRYRLWQRRGSDDLPLEEGETPPCFRLILEDFADAVLSSRPPAVSMYDGLSTMNVIDALYASAKAREEQHVDQSTIA